MPSACQRCLKPSEQKLIACGQLSLCSECASRVLQAKKKVKKNKAGERPQLVGAAALREMPNEALTNYYKSQLSAALENEEWEKLEACLRSPLPVTWRFSGFDESTVALREMMERRLLPALDDSALRPYPLGWYPQELAWQSRVSRAALRGKDWEGADAAGGGGRPAAVKALHAWLMREQDLGRVQRQESVSMVPPMVLDVHPGMTILDMCASPGSKTQQLVEMIGGADGDGGGGLVVANDADVKRCHMLASRASRLHSPCLLVINHDARLLPEDLGVAAPSADAATATTAAASASASSSAPAGAVPSFIDSSFTSRVEYEAWAAGATTATAATAAATAAATGSGDESVVRVPLRFDRILADVPCSGDGTLRKNPLIWKRWTATPGNMLHSVQHQIACKGVRLLKVSRPAPHSTRDPRLFTATWASSQPWPRAGGRAARLLHLLPQPRRE